MKVLLDRCVYGPAMKTIIAAGHDVRWMGDDEVDPGDQAILTAARAEGRVLVTLDNDFGELAIVRGQPHCGIVRLVNTAASTQGEVIVRVLAAYGEILKAGALVVVEAGRIRVRST